MVYITFYGFMNVASELHYPYLLYKLYIRVVLLARNSYETIKCCRNVS